MKCLKLFLIVSLCVTFNQSYALANAFQWDSGYKSDAPDADEIDVSVTNLAGALSTADTNVQLALDTLDDAVQTTTDAIEGVSFTDGTTTISGGNYTGVGNITGTDVDISAGTGAYTSSGTLGAGAVTGTSLTASGAGQSTIGDLIVGDSVSLDSTGGKLTIEGEGGSNDENITLDFETTANAVLINSTTGVDQWVFQLDAFVLQDNKQFKVGTGGDGRYVWDSGTTNSSLQMATRVGSAAGSGYVSIVELVDLGHNNREPLATSADPVLRVYSSDAAVATDYIEMFHDQATATIQSGDGTVSFGSDVVKTSYYMTTGYYTTLNFPGSGAPVGSIITIGGPDGNCGGEVDGTVVNVCVSDGDNWIPV